MALQGAIPWEHQDGQLATADIIKGLAEGKVRSSIHHNLMHSVRIVILLSSYNSIFEQFIVAFDSPKGHYGASQRRYACAAPGGCQ